MSWLDSVVGAVAVQSSGVAVGQRATLNFSGSTVTDDPLNARVNISGSAAVSIGVMRVSDYSLSASQAASPGLALTGSWDGSGYQVIYPVGYSPNDGSATYVANYTSADFTLVCGASSVAVPAGAVAVLVWSGAPFTATVYTSGGGVSAPSVSLPAMDAHHTYYFRLQEVSGSTFANSGSAGGALTMSTPANWALSATGGAYHLPSGSTSVASLTGLSFGGPLTIECYAKLMAYNGALSALFNVTGDASNYFLAAIAASSFTSAIMQAWTAGSDHGLYPSTAAGPTSTVHLAYVLDGTGVVKTFLNGRLLATSAAAPLTHTISALYLGNSSGGASVSAAAVFGGLMISNIARSDAYIASSAMQCRGL